MSRACGAAVVAAVSRSLTTVSTASTRGPHRAVRPAWRFARLSTRWLASGMSAKAPAGGPDIGRDAVRGMRSTSDPVIVHPSSSTDPPQLIPPQLIHRS